MSKRLSWVGMLLMVVLALLAWPSSVRAAVTVQRAEVIDHQLLVEGTAAPDRDITVDGVVRGRSASDGRFRIERALSTPPATCTVDVNDGAARPASARLRGCVVTSPTTAPTTPSM
jgi:hypothetical protein